MRLIDADKLTDALNLWGCYELENPRAYNTLMLYEILGAIENQPTAYDVDKVIEALRESESYSCSPMFSRGIETAIDIVRRGEVDDIDRIKKRKSQD